MSQENVERCLNYIRDKAKELAMAKADRVYLEHFRKSKKAILMKEAEENGVKTSASQEREAYAHEDYLQLLSGLRAATEKEEKLKFEMKAAELKFEKWRTEQANNRMERTRYQSS